MNKGFKEKNGGITLIALVVTIVVLLILAGVSLNAVIGNSGIVNRTQEASKETDIAETREQILMELMGIYAGSGDYTNDDVIEAVKTVTGEDIEEGTATITTAKGNEVDISDLWGDIQVAISDLEIGDYIDIGIPYDNVVSFSSSYTYTDEALTGWRVLSIGEDGVIKLVSAGCPLSYYIGSKSTTSIYELNNIYVKGINEYNEGNVLTSATDGGDCFYDASGFYTYDTLSGVWDGTTKTYNMENVFGTSSIINLDEGIHALKAGDNSSGTNMDEVENLFNTMMNNMLGKTQGENGFYSYPLIQLCYNRAGAYGYNKYVFKTSFMESKITDAEMIWNNKYTDLLGIGQHYWLRRENVSRFSLWVLEDREESEEYISA